MQPRQILVTEDALGIVGSKGVELFKDVRLKHLGFTRKKSKLQRPEACSRKKEGFSGKTGFAS